MPQTVARRGSGATSVLANPKPCRRERSPTAASGRKREGDVVKREVSASDSEARTRSADRGIHSKAAFDTGDPAGELAQEACDLHRQWLCIFYPKYSKEYHKGLGEMYVADERFRANYDKLAPGCAKFLRDAINHYCMG